MKANNAAYLNAPPPDAPPGGPAERYAQAGLPPEQAYLDGLPPDMPTLSPGGGYPGMMPAFPEPTTYLKDSLQFEPYTDYLAHMLHGDVLTTDPQTGEARWNDNTQPLGSRHGPMMSPEGIRILLTKVIAFLNKFATHANLSDEEIHGYTFEAAADCLMWMVLEQKTFSIQRWAWDQIVLLVDSQVYLNLTRTIGGAESQRIAGMYQARDLTPHYVQSQKGFLDHLPLPWQSHRRP